MGRQGVTFYGENIVVYKCEHLTLIKHQRPDLRVATIRRILFIVPLQSPVVSNPFIACVASVSLRGSSRKLGQEQKKKE